MPLRAVVDVRVAAPGLRVVGVARLRGAALDVDAVVHVQHKINWPIDTSPKTCFCARLMASGVGDESY